MNLEALCSIFSEDQPSGSDPEYDLAFTELEIAAQPQEERQAGDDILPGADPDYKLVKVKALEVLSQSHDLRAAVFLAEAELRLSGLPGFSKAMSYIIWCLSEHWATCHPQLDADDDDDATMRINAIGGLSDFDKIIRGLQRVPLAKSKVFGEISWRDIAVAEGDISVAEGKAAAHDVETIAAAFQDADAGNLSEIKVAGSDALKSLLEINAIFDVKTPAVGPNLDDTIKCLKKINSRLNGASSGLVLDDDASDASDDGKAGLQHTAEAYADQASGGSIHSINSQKDVHGALDKIIAYYARSEPSSPVPILLTRAKRLVGADFLSIVKDMAPNGIDNVHLISGVENSE